MQGLRPALSQVTPRQEGRGRIKPKADPFRGYASRDQGHTPPCREALTSSTSRPGEGFDRPSQRTFLGAEWDSGVRRNDGGRGRQFRSAPGESPAFAGMTVYRE